MEDFKVYQASGYLTKLVTDASDVRKTYEEISGSLVEFDTPISAPLEELIVDINPIQSGTGDPSPDNVRPITGWTGANVYHSGEDTSSPTVYTVSWQDDAGTVYGGTVDLVSGVLTVEKAYVELFGADSGWQKSTSYPGGFYIGFMNFSQIYSSPEPKAYTPFICSHAKTANAISEYLNSTCYCDGSINIRIMESSSTLTDWENYLDEQARNGTPVSICYKLKVPIEIQLTPQEINALVGVNNIWADTGDVSVKYRTH